MKASAFNAALMLHGTKGDRNSQYEMTHVLESADDALTRQKMKEQFAAQTNGSLGDYLGKQKWDSAHGKDQALDLVSEKRDVATNNLAAMSPDKRADLEDKAVGWADKILDVAARVDCQRHGAIAADTGDCQQEIQRAAQGDGQESRKQLRGDHGASRCGPGVRLGEFRGNAGSGAADRPGLHHRQVLGRSRRFDSGHGDRSCRRRHGRSKPLPVLGAVVLDLAIDPDQFNVAAWIDGIVGMHGEIGIFADL